jgi:hypothetical protein
LLPRIQRFASGDPVADMQAAWVWLRTLGPVEVMYSSSVDDFVADSAIWTYESDGRLLRRMTPRAQAEKALNASK